MVEGDLIKAMSFVRLLAEKPSWTNFVVDVKEVAPGDKAARLIEPK